MAVYTDKFVGLKESDRETLALIFDKAKNIGDICSRANICKCIDLQEFFALRILVNEIDALLAGLKLEAK